MLDFKADIRDLNLAHWRRLSELALARQKARRLVLLHEDGAPFSLVDSQAGALPLPEGRMDDPQAWAEKLYAAHPGVYEVEVADPAQVSRRLSEISARAGLDTQEDEAARLFWEARFDTPGCAVHPRREFTWLGVPFDRLRRFADLIMPPACMFVLGVFDESGIWASLLVRFEDKKITLVSTFDALPAEELEGINTRDQHAFLLSLVSNTFRKPSFGWFVERADFEAYMRADDAPGRDEAFQRALLEKRATFDYSILVERSAPLLVPPVPEPEPQA